jgi:2'-5' RNA ligase
MRLFVALPMPDIVAQSLRLLQGGVPGARWHPRENLHLTLRFVGEVDGRQAADIDDALSAIRAPGFTLELSGVGTFGHRDPRQLWAGVRANDALTHLHRKIETAIQRIGLPPEPRKFTPHVTLARLKSPRRDKLMEFLSTHALYTSVPFAVNAFALYQSTLTPNGSLYTLERDYPLEAAP